MWQQTKRGVKTIWSDAKYLQHLLSTKGFDKNNYSLEEARETRRIGRDLFKAVAFAVYIQIPNLERYIMVYIFHLFMNPISWAVKYEKRDEEAIDRYKNQHEFRERLTKFFLAQWQRSFKSGQFNKKTFVQQWLDCDRLTTEELDDIVALLAIPSNHISLLKKSLLPTAIRSHIAQIRLQDRILKRDPRQLESLDQASLLNFAQERGLYYLDRQELLHVVFKLWIPFSTNPRVSDEEVLWFAVLNQKCLKLEPISA